MRYTQSLELIPAAVSKNIGERNSLTREMATLKTEYLSSEYDYQYIVKITTEELFSECVCTCLLTSSRPHYRL